MTAPLVLEDVALAGAKPVTITLTVPSHQAVAVVGEAATGLVQLAPIILGLQRPASGRALVFGEELGAMSRRAALAFRRRVGYVPEGDGLLQNLSLEDNIALPLQFAGDLSPRELHGRLRVVRAAFGLTNAGGLRPADADDEQRRRAAFARALVFDPSLVILAQPFDGIGTRAASELLDIARGGETVDGPRRTVFVTTQALAERLRARIEDQYRIVGGTLRAES
jgi:ABC-type transporter Mla maintaining outer membrane lipid asymmetry ATPase subunit MlaF